MHLFSVTERLFYFRNGRNHAYFDAVYQATERAVPSPLLMFGLVGALISELLLSSLTLLLLRVLWLSGQSTELGVGSPGL